MIRYLKRKIRNNLTARLNDSEIYYALERLSCSGFKPDFVFDVGAYKGDFALNCLRIWPSVDLACFEALPEKVGELEALSKKHINLRVFPTLLGKQMENEVILNASETASSILEEQVPQNFPKVICSMATVDHVIENDYKGRAPCLMKIDTQGYELEVLQGAERSLGKMKALLLELNLIDIHKGVPLADEIIRWLKDRDWVMYDICGQHRRPLDKALWQADVLFVKKDSFLRTDKRWNGNS